MAEQVKQPNQSNQPKTRGRRRRVLGVVVSDKMQKTIVVREERRIVHPAYEKVVSRYTRYKAHDEQRDAREGDMVEIVESRPLSRTKCWRLRRIVERATRPTDSEVAADLAGGVPAQL